MLYLQGIHLFANKPRFAWSIHHRARENRVVIRNAWQRMPMRAVEISHLTVTKYSNIIQTFIILFIII